MSRSNIVATGAVICVLLAGHALAEPAPVPHQLYPVFVSSGPLESTAATDQVVFSQVIDLGDVGWIRVLFASAQLEGDSYIRITSHEDGAVQTLDQQGLLEWDYSSAYFNGPAVTVELIAAPGTRGNSLSIEEVYGAGPSTGIPERVCVATDGRTSSGNAGVARLLIPPAPPGGGGCTGWIINRSPADDPHDACMLSAGHCFATGSEHAVVQFEPIADTVVATCTLKHPPAKKQFAVDLTSVLLENVAAGDDWAVFRVFPNTTTGKTIYEEQQSAFMMAAPALGMATKFGYGADGPATGDPMTTYCVCTNGDPASAASQTQQTHTAAIGTIDTGGGGGIRVLHSIHTCGGDSGSPIVQCGVGVAIHTSSLGCQTAPLPDNAGTAVNNADLQTAITSLCPDTFPPLVVTLSSFTAEGMDGSVVLRWSTESEIDNEGFQVLRSTDPDGDFEVVSFLIPAEGGPGFGADYEFVDDTAEAGATYYYKLEDIDTSGVSTLHGADACTFGSDPDCEPLAVTVPGLSAADFCTEHEIRSSRFWTRWSDRWACVLADWKDNEPDQRFPNDCRIASDRGSRSLACVATENAD